MNIPKNTLITQLLKIFVSLQVDTDGYEYILLLGNLHPLEGRVGSC